MLFAWVFRCTAQVLQKPIMPVPSVIPVYSRAVVQNQDTSTSVMVLVKCCTKPRYQHKPNSTGQMLYKRHQQLYVYWFTSTAVVQNSYASNRHQVTGSGENGWGLVLQLQELFSYQQLYFLKDPHMHNYCFHIIYLQRRINVIHKSKQCLDKQTQIILNK